MRLDLIASGRLESLDGQQNIYSTFCQIAKAQPLLPAITLGYREITYGELDALINLISSNLLTYGVHNGVAAGVCMPRSDLLVATIFAIFKLGGVYVPIDSSYPQKAIKNCLEIANIKFIITDNDAISDYASGVTPIHPDSLSSCLVKNQYDSESSGYKNNNGACIFFTSGTTGLPKGILSTHSGIINYRSYIKNSFSVDQNDVVLQLAPLAFDASIRDLIIPITLGANIVLMEDSTINNPNAVIENIRKTDATCILSIVPTKLSALTMASKISNDTRTSLRLILTSGEILKPSLCNDVSQYFAPNAEIINQYGASECTMSQTFHRVDNDELYQDGMPIGEPIENTQIYLINPIQESNNERIGEIGIGGAGFTGKYLNPDHPDNKNFLHIDSNYVFNTRDIARYNDKTRELILIGRSDRYVKIKGVGVNLNLLESLMQKSELASNIAAVKTEGNSIGVFVTGADFNEQLFMEWCKANLDRLVVPSRAIYLESFPLTPVGKVDYVKLSEFTLNERTDYPMTNEEAVLRHIFSEILNIEETKISRQDSFFHLGGDSILSVLLLDEIERRFLIDLPIEGLIQHPSLAQMASMIACKRNADSNYENKKYYPNDDITVADSIILPDRTLSSNEIENVFLTGATGYLGTFLLRKLLVSDKNVTCLIRAKNKKDGFSRIKSAMERYALWDAELAEHIDVSIGDMTKENFGMSRSDFIKTANHIQQIYHCAATVNFAYSCKMLRDANILALYRIIEMANINSEIRNLQFTSTDSVFPVNNSSYSTPPKDIDIHENGDDLKDGYSQSKLIAEKICLKMRNQLPINIYRLARAFGDTISGLAVNDSDLLTAIVRHCITVGQVPISDKELYLLPADFVASCLFALSENDNGTYHIFPEVPIKFSEFTSILNTYHPSLKIIPMKNWLESFDKTNTTLLEMSRTFFGNQYRIQPSEAMKNIGIYDGSSLNAETRYDYLNKVMQNFK